MTSDLKILHHDHCWSANNIYPVNFKKTFSTDPSRTNSSPAVGGGLIQSIAHAVHAGGTGLARRVIRLSSQGVECAAYTRELIRAVRTNWTVVTTRTHLIRELGRVGQTVVTCSGIRDRSTGVPRLMKDGLW